jgi:glycosyltransferase involved in cell wall biosynthesis
MEKVASKDVSPIMYLPNFSEMSEEFHEIQHNYNLLFVGRLEKVKGIEFLIEAIPFIIKIFPQTTLTIIGEGQNKESLLNLTKDLHLEKHVHFVGWVKNKDLDIYYQKASIVVTPSVCQEIFGLVILEAMGAGRPVIGTNVGGISEIIVDGVNGYLVEPQSPEQIAEKVIKLFSDEDLLKAFGKNARKKAQEFSLEKYAINLVHIYEQIMSKHKSYHDRN